MTLATPSITHHTVTANGIRQHYIDAGNGPAVVLLHGFPETSFAWRFQMFDMKSVWESMATNLRAEPIAQCGHLPQEEQPERVNALLLDFLKHWEG
ncbi:alpha/beta fold hydrolase [Burkholderia pyrrocinia]|uniref:Alpha/beta hydrolase n=1 Tax=Burkholderia pyrrocinia TaxID=60550 RepID=A0ABZ3BY26_BURPY